MKCTNFDYQLFFVKKNIHLSLKTKILTNTEKKPAQIFIFKWIFVIRVNELNETKIIFLYYTCGLKVLA